MTPEYCPHCTRVWHLCICEPRATDVRPCPTCGSETCPDPAVCRDQAAQRAWFKALARLPEARQR